MQKIRTIFALITLSQLFTAHAFADCASDVFSNALASTAHTVSESDDETKIQQWIHQTFTSHDVLGNVLKCPEITSVADTDIIKFAPIKYTFDGGREIIVNYETQPRILRQRLSLATKRELPLSDPNPSVGAHDTNSVWTNTEPAWYAIMVVEHGALDDFVGPNKNNTIALEYIHQNIDKLYPHGNTCTSRSALANDNYAINRATAMTVNIDDDTNDYYVAGDVNLQWISYTEIALDVVLTVATMGGSTVISGATKAARASRVLKDLTSSIRALSRVDAVRDYIRATQTVDRLTDELRTIDATTDAVRHAAKTAELNTARTAMQTLESNADVKKYRDATRSFSELNAYRRNLRALRLPQRGNIIARAARATRASFTGGAKIGQGAKIARSSKLSTQIRDWLFQTSLQHAGALAKMTAAGGLIYGALRFVGDMYDYTETSTGDFTSGVEFAPLLLLSADDLAGQENVVNHGMWLMWAGSATTPADDDAAYLQAMDFAAKFHQDLTEIQDNTSTPCDIDIYVVRPILRNAGTDSASLYYLVMNDTPWTTH